MGQKTIPKFCKIFRIKAVAGSAINEVLLISFYFGQSSWIWNSLWNSYSSKSPLTYSYIAYKTPQQPYMVKFSLKLEEISMAFEFLTYAFQ